MEVKGTHALAATALGLVLAVLVGCQAAIQPMAPASVPSPSGTMAATTSAFPATSDATAGIVLREIPAKRSMAGWKAVPIQESGEPLVELNGIHPRIVVDARYHQQHIAGASDRQYLRKGAADRLVAAANRLPEGYKLVVFDAYRPLAVQQALFDSYKEIVKKDMPGASEEEIAEATQKYVSLPSSDLTRPSPHATGGAIDLSILGPDGRRLNMGTDFDSFEPQAGTDYFKDRPGGEEIHRNRQLLYTLLADAGFTNYPEEWWHFDYGNQFWGHLSGKEAIYSLADALPPEKRGCDCPRSPTVGRETLMQISTIDALMAGVYDGMMGVGRLKEYGDFGLGTLDRLDGEMIVLDGEAFQIKADGLAYRVADNASTPFAVATFFDPDLHYEPASGTSLAGLQEHLDRIIPTANTFYAIKIQGSFSHVRTRSVPAQHKPYPVLSEVTKNQSVFEFHDIEGTVVGFRCPPYIQGINVPGYHLHFLTEARNGGGHVLDFEVKDVRVSVDETPSFLLALPGADSDFYRLDLTQDRQAELEKAEK